MPPADEDPLLEPLFQEELPEDEPLLHDDPLPDEE
jgi:hypothetical protein